MARQNSNGQVVDEQGERESLDDMDGPEVLGSPIEGTAEQLSFDLGSEWDLSDSTLKLAPVPPLAVQGQFSEGDRVRVVLEIEVEYIAFPPIKDKGFRVGTERRHFGQILSAAHLTD
jgi:hypothetical protein